MTARRDAETRRDYVAGHGASPTRGITAAFDDWTGPEAPLDALVAQVKAEEQRKKALAAELDGLQALAKVRSLDSARLKRNLADRVAGIKEPLTRNTAQARQALRKLLEDRIAVGPVEQNGKRGFFTGKGTFGRLLAGEAAPLMVVPPG